MIQPMTTTAERPARTTMRVASAPVSFGVDEVIPDDAWMPGPDEMLDWMAELDYKGTELGPPGFFGSGTETRERLAARHLALVGSFLPQHFSRAEKVEEDRAWLRRTLGLLRQASEDPSKTFAILCDGIDETERRRLAGRIADHREAWLPNARFETLIDNLHAAAEICREAGFEPVIHPHAGTYIETAAEIARVVDRLDPSLVGLCLDTGHFRFGGTVPARSIRDYASVIRHVHIKDCCPRVIPDVAARGGGLDEMLKAGVFCPLGQGDVSIPAAVEALHEIDYQGWLVVEQDQHLYTTDTRASLVERQRRNREFLRALGV